MSIQEVYLTITDRLNKLSTNYSQSISFQSFIRAFNKAQWHWIEERIKLRELNSVRVDELQQIIKCVELKGVKSNLFYTFVLPSDYYRFNRVDVVSGDCILKTHLVEEGNIGELLKNEHTKPSKEWEETLVTLKDNKVNVWTNDEFSVTSILLTYYRNPIQVDISGYETLSGSSSNIDPEFENSSLQEIIDLTVKIIGGDIQDQFTYQTANERTQRFT